MLFPHVLIPIAVIAFLVLILILTTPKDKLKQNLKQCRIGDVRKLKRQQRKELQRQERQMRQLQALARRTLTSPWEKIPSNYQPKNPPNINKS